MSTGREIEEKVRVRGLKIAIFTPFPILLEWKLLSHKRVIISQACGKGICGAHRTPRGEGGGGRKLGECSEPQSGR